MRKSAIGLVVAGMASSLVLGACSSSSKTLSSATPSVSSEAQTGGATAGASTKVTVSVVPAVRSDHRAPAVVALLTRRYTDINERNFDDYFAMYTPRYGARFDPAQVEAGYRSTQVSSVDLTELRTSGDGRLAATVTFTSSQDAADGPDGETCTHWKVSFFLKDVQGKYLIDAPPSNYHAEHAGC
jgi:hypothetical protein